MQQIKKILRIVLFFFFFLNRLNEGVSQAPQPLPGNGGGSSKHFVLVHGACHGAWSWFKVIPLLRSSGDNVTAIDLAASGINPQQINTLKSLSQHYQPLNDLMASLPPHERVILVGHSLGGFAISQAMEKFPHKISVAVFLTALMPGPSLNASSVHQESQRRQGDQLDKRFTFDDGPNNPPTSVIFGALYLKSMLYQFSPIEDWTLAITMMRAEPLPREDDFKSGVLALTRKKYGSVKRVFIISEKDMRLKKDFQRWMIQRNPPNQVHEIKGSDHMVMMSKPKELSVSLLRIAEMHA